MIQKRTLRRKLLGLCRTVFLLGLISLIALFSGGYEDHLVADLIGAAFSISVFLLLVNAVTGVLDDNW